MNKRSFYEIACARCHRLVRVEGQITMCGLLTSKCVHCGFDIEIMRAEEPVRKPQPRTITGKYEKPG